MSPKVQNMDISSHSKRTNVLNFFINYGFSFVICTRSKTTSPILTSKIIRIQKLLPPEHETSTACSKETRTPPPGGRVASYPRASRSCKQREVCNLLNPKYQIDKLLWYSFLRGILLTSFSRPGVTPSSGSKPGVGVKGAMCLCPSSPSSPHPKTVIFDFTPSEFWSRDPPRIWKYLLSHPAYLLAQWYPQSHLLVKHLHKYFSRHFI